MQVGKAQMVYVRVTSNFVDTIKKIMGELLRKSIDHNDLSRLKIKNNFSQVVAWLKGQTQKYTTKEMIQFN